jgi:RimJ/RimL family protein N-acetyltransferase
MIYKDGLESDRLTTRFLQTADVNVWTTFMKNPLATELFPLIFREHPEEQAPIWIERQITRYKENRFGLQAIIEKSSGNFIGQCGLLKQEVDGDSYIEIGYHILPEYWGKGYAPEAARLFLNYGFTEFGFEQIISIINIHNTKSQRVAMKNGLKQGHQTVWNEIDVHIWKIDREDFLSQTSVK